MQDAIAAAEAKCTAENLRLTPVRRRVLELLLEGHRALGAYDILKQLQAENLGSQPPIAYRALQFLTTHGFVHRIERLNAYVACVFSDSNHQPTFMICRECDSVAEAGAHPVKESLDHAAETMGFTPEHMMIEVEGLCPVCVEAQA
ncbi:transcriptional repressor [Rhodophyticola sp. CCM32]|uniref:transcriptional repressor n=1 Tax=Rhodophyticola sp. CCM32 TaxID=2916397 RepID=UPI003083624C